MSKRIAPWLFVALMTATALVSGCGDETTPPSSNGAFYSIPSNPYASVGAAHNNGVAYIEANFDTTQFPSLRAAGPDNTINTEARRVVRNWLIASGIDTNATLTSVGATLSQIELRYHVRYDSIYRWTRAAILADTTFIPLDRVYGLQVLELAKKGVDSTWTHTQMLDSAVALQSRICNDENVTATNCPLSLTGVAVLVASTDYWKTAEGNGKWAQGVVAEAVDAMAAEQGVLVYHDPDKAEAVSVACSALYTMLAKRFGLPL